MAVDYSSDLAHTSTNPTYYPHANLELQIPAAVIDPSMLPPSPPTAVDYNSPHSAAGAPYVASQQLSYYNDMGVFVDLNALAPEPGEQNYL